jgi:hypothetical protein
LNGYPKLRQFLKVDISDYENISVEWIGGMSPEAFLMDQNGELLESFPLVDMDVDQIKALLAEKGFQLIKKKITLSEPIKIVTFARKKYHVFAELFNFESAKEVAHSLGGRLVTIKSESEDAFINDLLANEDGKHYWLSATDVEEEGVWRGAGETLQYLGWAENEPNNAGNTENCAVIKPSVQRTGWNDRDCSEKHQVIVEFDLDTEKEL